MVMFLFYHKDPATFYEQQKDSQITSGVLLWGIVSAKENDSL